LLDQALHALPKVSFNQMYGMTELSASITVLPAWYHTRDGRAANKLLSAGRPVPIAQVRILNAAGMEVPRGSVGEIVARGPMMMQGYWGKPEQTALAVRDGWMYTGDAGYMDEDGFVYVVDRIKDVIVTGGENVYSAEVEGVILQMPGIAACAVIGVPDESWGERVMAIVVPQDAGQIDAQSVITFCRERIAGYKCPRTVEFRSELPLSPVGKILKHRLREPYWRGRARNI
jgi:acyl-CoA synthetase (AMP-forming)/AMP-acid ligase II